jgi:hypothetical protein
MFRFKGPAKAGSLFLLSLAATGIVPAAQAAELTFQGPSDDNATDEAIDWGNPDNWSSGTVAGQDDDVTVAPDPTFRGPIVSDERKAKSLKLNAGINIHRGGSLTVTDGITINATPGYFINDGTVTGTLVNNAYISSTYEFHGDVTNNAGAATINESVEGGDATATWYGDVVENHGDIYNIDGIWNGDVLSNDGFITSHGVWNGSIDNTTGSMELSGVVNGDLDHAGGSLTLGNLAVSGNFNNSSGFGMDGGAADTVLTAKSWSGNGMAAFDLSTALGRSDHVVLSGDYTAETALGFNIVGPSERVLGDIPLIIVGGTNSGTLTLTGLPEDGVISYRLVQSGNDWVLTTSLSEAPARVAAALEFMGRTLASAERVPLARAGACGTGGWARGLGGAYDSTISDIDSHIDLGGVQVGYDASCFTFGPDATLGLGVTGGGVFGRIDQDFDDDGGASGDFQQGFAGIYANVAAGPLRAVLQSQFGLSSTSLSDPQSGLDDATLTTTRFDVSGSASYALALGAVSIAPELGFAAAIGKSRSDDFADVGTMSLESDPELDAFIGATFSGNLALADGTTTVAPSVSVALHDDLSPSTATFTDDAGGTAEVPVDGLGTYVAVGVGADILYMPVTSGMSMDAGLRADFKFGNDVTESSVGGYARVTF